MKVGKRIHVIGAWDTETIRLQGEMQKWRSFSQYTDIEALLCILSNKELKANCLRNVDDLKEQSYLQPLIDNDEALPFVACFDHENEESISLWKMYAGHNYGIKLQINLPDDNKSLCSTLLEKYKPVKGCRPGCNPVLLSQIQFENKEYEFPKVFVQTTTNPITYKNSLQNPSYQLPASNLINISTLAAVKSTAWSFQNEARIVAFLEHVGHTATNDEVEPVDIPAFEYLLLPICFNRLESIEITFSPWMGKETKRMVREKVDGLKLDCKCILFRDSSLTGTIRIK